jgi:Fic family protein
MVSNVYDAMLAARDDPAAPLTPATILRYHGIVAAGAVDDPADAGAFRRRDDIVVGNALTGKVIYRPPPAGALPRLVFELCRWHAATDEDPFVAAALLHYFVGWLHPFVDGNGRTARVLWYWACARHAGLDRVWHLSLSGGIAEDWRPYNKGFRLAQQSGDITPFLERQALYLERVVAAVAGRA